MTTKRTLTTIAVATAAVTVATAGALTLPQAKAAGRNATVVANPGAVREWPKTSAKIKKWIPHGTTIKIECQMTGEEINGKWGKTKIWNRIAGVGYISDGWVDTGTNGWIPGVPNCVTGKPPKIDSQQFNGTYYLPYAGGTSQLVTQGQNSSPTHHDYYNRYAIDFGMDSGTPVLASAPGKVIHARWDNTGYGNMMLIDHGNDTCTQYAHLHATSGFIVGEGTQVKTGQHIGTSGSTGWSTGAHLHWGVVRCSTGESLSSLKTFEGGVSEGNRPVSQNPGK